jgi:hypothetical protein
VSGKELAKPISADTIQVLKIAPQNERAVIKTPDGKIAADRVVVEEKNGNEIEKVIFRSIDGKQKMNGRKNGEQASAMLSPVDCMSMS